jgi:hypothetical protein
VVSAGPAKLFLLLYNGQPLITDLPEEAMTKFAALEALCKPPSSHPLINLTSLGGPQSAFTDLEKQALTESLNQLKEIYAM